MAETTRAKFRCNRENSIRYSDTSAPQRVYDFSAVYDTSTPENERFATATPSGSITITVDNPAVTLEPGAEYYIDFTKA